MELFRLPSAGAEGRGGCGTALRATQRRRGRAGPARRGGGGAGRPARRWGASERESERELRERARVSPRANKYGGVRRVSDLGHTAKIFFLFFILKFIFAVCHRS